MAVEAPGSPGLRTSVGASTTARSGGFKQVRPTGCFQSRVILPEFKLCSHVRSSVEPVCLSFTRKCTPQVRKQTGKICITCKRLAAVECGLDRAEGSRTSLLQRLVCRGLGRRLGHRSINVTVSCSDRPTPKSPHYVSDKPAGVGKAWQRLITVLQERTAAPFIAAALGVALLAGTTSGSMLILLPCLQGHA